METERLRGLAALYLDGHDVRALPVLAVPDVRAIAARAIADPHSVTRLELAAISLFAMTTSRDSRRGGAAQPSWCVATTGVPES